CETLLHVFVGAEHGSVLTSSRSEAEAAFREGRFENGLQYLGHRLLNHPIHHRRNAQRPSALTVRLRYFYPPDRLGYVGAVEYPLPYLFPVLAAIRHQVLNGHPVDARCPAVSHHTLIRLEHVLASQHLLDEFLLLVPGLFFACRACLTLYPCAARGSAAFGRRALGHPSPTCRVFFTHRTLGSGSSLHVRPVRHAATWLLWPLLTSARLALALRLHFPLRAGVRTSEGKAPDFRPIRPSHLRPPVRMTSGFECLRPLAHRTDASCTLRVPRAGILPAASSGRSLAVAPLLFGKKFLSSRSPRDFHLPVISRSAFAFRFSSGTSPLRAMPLTRSPGGSHPRALTEPDVKLSPHPAPPVPAAGDAPRHQCAKRVGSRRAIPPNQCTDARSRRRNLRYFHRAHAARASLRCRRT